MERAGGSAHVGGLGGILWAPAVFLAFCFVFGCATDIGASAQDKAGKPLKIEPVQIPGFRATKTPGGQNIFNSQKEWGDFWANHNTTPAPEFDFKDFTLVTVFLGQRPNSGYSVKIIGATEYPGKVVVNVVEYLPSPGMLYAQVIVYPHDAILIPKTRKEIRFEVAKKVGRP